MENTTTIDWPTGSSDNAASNVKTATIIQFVPRPNPKRPTLTEAGDNCIMDHTHYPDPPLAEYVASAGYPIDTGIKIGHPWSGEDKA